MAFKMSTELDQHLNEHLSGVPVILAPALSLCCRRPDSRQVEGALREQRSPSCPEEPRRKEPTPLTLTPGKGQVSHHQCEKPALKRVRSIWF